MRVKRARLGVAFTLLLLPCCVANAWSADQSGNRAGQPDAEPTSACASLAQKDFPKTFKSSSWFGRAISKEHVWDCGANQPRHYEELYFQLGLSVSGGRIAGGLSCQTSQTLRSPAGSAYTTESGRGGVITGGKAVGSHYSFHVVFCDDYTQSCDLRGRTQGDDLLAGTYTCNRAGKQVDSGIWSVRQSFIGQPRCPDLYGPQDFRDKAMHGMVEFAGSPAKPVPGAKLTVICGANRKIVGQAETDANGRYTIAGTQGGVRYDCILDPAILGYRKGAMICIANSFFDWRVAKGFNPIITLCNPDRWPQQCHDPQARSYHAYNAQSDDVEMSGYVAYETKSVPFKYAPGAKIEVCSASNKLLGSGRTDAQGYYEVHVPINRGPYSCRLYPSKADASAGYLGGVAGCHAGGWLLRLGQTPSATGGVRCLDYLGPCPAGSISYVDVRPLTGECLP